MCCLLYSIVLFVGSKLSSLLILLVMSLNSLNFEKVLNFSFIKNTQAYLEKLSMNVTMYRMPLIEGCLANPNMSECISFNGSFPLKFTLHLSIGESCHIDTLHTLCLFSLSS